LTCHNWIIFFRGFHICPAIFNTMSMDERSPKEYVSPEIRAVLRGGYCVFRSSKVGKT